jgi:hypothetical protein
MTSTRDEFGPSRSVQMRRYVGGAIRRLARTSRVRKWVEEICSQEPERPIRLALVAVLLVESAARPRSARVVEWAMAVPLRSMPVESWARRGRAMTVGPLQLAGAPWNRRRSIDCARARLAAAEMDSADVVALAHFWNGSRASGDRGSLDYADALRMAMASAHRLISDH